MSASARAYDGPCCPHCGGPLLVELLTAGEQRCIACTRGFEATPFSPPAARLVVAGVAEAGPGGAVPCAQHAGNAAVANCSRCGVFMCALCEVRIDGRELCPACFDRLAAEGVLPSARGRLRNYRGLAFIMGLGGCGLYVFGLLTGPLTLYFAVQAQRQRRRLRETDGLATVVLAFVLGLLQIAGCLVFIVSMIAAASRTGSR